jgi:hypothetical protein
MKRISFKPQFVNAAGNDLIPGKIHTIRQNYNFWKGFEGRDVALYTWDGTPYRKGSAHKIFCVKKIIYVQGIVYDGTFNADMGWVVPIDNKQKLEDIAKNDGFENYRDFVRWFREGNYKHGRMAILHFTDFRY